MKKILKIFIITLLLLILLVNISIIVQTKIKPDSVPGIFGYKPFIVLSGSMQSEIYVGDLVIVKEVDPSTLKIGDIIAFRESENIVTTHRIVELKTQDNQVCFITKGDANNVNDSGLVYSNMLEGKYKTRIPRLGNAILFIQQPMGFAILMMSILIICIFIYLYQNRKIDKETKFKNEEEQKAFEEFLKTRAEKNEQNDEK